MERKPFGRDWWTEMLDLPTTSEGIEWSSLGQRREKCKKKENQNQNRAEKDLKRLLVQLPA